MKLIDLMGHKRSLLVFEVIVMFFYLEQLTKFFTNQIIQYSGCKIIFSEQKYRAFLIHL